jgi:hypothetical protein
MPDQEGRVCPYCDGKGYVSVDTQHTDSDTKTWIRKDCPLCQGTGHLYRFLHERYKEIATRAGLNPEEWHLHRFRDTAATRWLRPGIDVRTVQEWFGHESLATCPSPKLHLHGLDPRVTLLHPQAILAETEDAAVWQITDSEGVSRAWSFDEGLLCFPNNQASQFSW